VSAGSALTAAASFALCAAALLAGCASRVEVPEARRGAVVNPPTGAQARSQRGNPPFYDVFGKRYFVMPTSDGYVERGVASWYGPDFHKQMTSSGDRYDMYGMTAAHKTLPLPTWVEVTNLENGRHVTVKVNDRGPFVKGRIIDLSYGAAKALDMIRAGTARVEVRALGAPSRTASTPEALQAVAEPSRRPAATAWTQAASAPPTASAPPPVASEPPIASAPPSTASAGTRAVSAAPVTAAGGPQSAPSRPAAGGSSSDGSGKRSRHGAGIALISEAAADEVAPSERLPAPAAVTQQLFVQVGAFSSAQNAARVVDGLRARGYANAFMLSDGGDGLNRVRVGPLTGAAEFDRVTAGLRGLGYADTRLIAE
jgi:rare lipoprotein A